MPKITQIRHSWPEKTGFYLDRPVGLTTYTFLHFFNPVSILINEEIVETNPHACVIYAVGTPQFFVSSQPLTHDWIHFEGELDEQLAQFGLSCDIIYYPENPNFITELVREMEYEFYSGKSHSEEMLKLKTEELLIKFSRACAEGNLTVVDNSTHERFRLVREEIFSNLKDAWTVERMAKLTGLSKSRFYTLYRTIYGTSPMDDLIHARIESAKNGLLFSKQSIQEIAENLGYNNVTHFMRQFKGLTGTTPNQFRKNGHTGQDQSIF